MTTIRSITLEVADTTAAKQFYSTGFGLDGEVQLRDSDAPTSGFRGFTLSLIVSHPADVDALVADALAAGATELKAPSKSLWGYGAVVQAPDGTIWQVATSSKKNKGPATRKVEEIVLLLGVSDVAETKRFYLERGLTVGRSFGRKYVEFDTAGSPVKLSLYNRKALAKVAGVPIEGSGSHRLVIGSDGDDFTDPDGFVWESVG